MSHTVANPLNCSLVVVTKYNKGVAQIVANLISKMVDNQFKTVIVSEGDPAVELKELKERTGGKGAKDEDKIVMAVQGETGGAAIRFLCDDFDKPPEERRVVWIHSMSVGLDPFRFSEIPKHIDGILITNGKRSQSRPISEHVMASIFYFNRQIYKMQELKRERKFEKFSAHPMYGQKLCIMGYGDIGEAVGRLAVAFGMEVEAIKRSVPAGQTGPTYVDRHGVTVHAEERGSGGQGGGLSDDEYRAQYDAQLARMIEEADYIVNVLPGTPNTINFFDIDKFTRMKRSALYINVGRGCTNKEDDVVKALNDDLIRGASLDAFVEEPLPESSPLWAVPEDKLLLSPHISGQTANQLPDLTARFVSLCKRWQRGEEMESESVNRQYWY